MKKIFLAAFLTAFAFSWVFAEIQTKDDKAFIKGLRPMGMGGAFIAVSDDDNAFFYNPAGISQRESFLLSIPLPPFIITAGVDLESFEMAEFINDNYDDLQNFNDLYDSGQAGDLIQKINDKVVGKTTNIYLSLLNPSYISGKIKAGGENYFNFGIGVFDYINIDAGFKHGMPVPAVYYKAQATAVIPVPVSYKINSLEKIGLPGSLSVGINFKYILRAKATDRVSLAELTNEDAYEFPAYLGKGFGADIGAIYHFNPRWNFGLQISDIFATSLKYENLKVNDSAV
ncbi:MAG: hypothetical protein LBQ47_09250, partial [Endomicrobium sp.]|nr:hypothetical protein [Endomicrobium sp.]